jgi:uncharacterized repeat protein (TIGR03803 family)
LLLLVYPRPLMVAAAVKESRLGQSFAQFCDFGTAERLVTQRQLEEIVCDGSSAALGAGVDGLLEGSDGMLYGTTGGGGNYGYGTVFKLSKTGSGYTTLHHFGATTSDGTGPSGALVEDGDGYLCGAAGGGGNAGYGTVFKMRKDGSDYQVLKSFTGSTRTALIEAFANTPFRLALTATPAPNDFTELGNHSEFLGIKSRVEMLAEFFVHDGGSTQDWRIKGHAVRPFWQWVATWGAVVKMPSDLGHDDGPFRLPAKVQHEHVAVALHLSAALDRGVVRDGIGAGDRSLPDR